MQLFVYTLCQIESPKSNLFYRYDLGKCEIWIICSPHSDKKDMNCEEKMCIIRF